MTSKTIVLIHGLSASKHGWQPWVERYQARGYKVITPVYHPDLDKSLATLQADTNNEILRTITLPQVIDHLAQVVKKLDEKPIIMGHSFGGTLSQHLLQRDLCAACVAIDSPPPLGVPPLYWSFIRSGWPALNPVYSASTPWYMTFEQFQYAWAHTSPFAEQRAAYEALIVPEARRLYRAGVSKDAALDWKRERAPLLITAGTDEHIIPAAMCHAVYKRYAAASPSRTDFIEFPGRTHYSVVAGQGWQEVADYALNWAVEAQTATVPRSVRAAAQPA